MNNDTFWVIDAGYHDDSEPVAVCDNEEDAIEWNEILGGGRILEVKLLGKPIDRNNRVYIVTMYPDYDRKC